LRGGAAEGARTEPIHLSATSFDEAEVEAARRALAGRVAGNGPFGQRVEKRLSEMLDGRRVLLTTSCTHALELALLALDVGGGDEVICPSFTFVSTANAILRAGATPVFAEIDDATLGLDPADVAARVTTRTAAILPVHYAGVAPDMDGLMAVARDRGLRVVEDAAQGLAASYRGTPLGAIGDAGCFSFHETKNISCGEGGALAVADPELAARAEIIREKGTNRSAFLRGEVDKYTWVDEGSSYIQSDILAAVLDAQLDKLAAIQRRRREISLEYRERLGPWAAKHGVHLPPDLPDRATNDHLFALLLPDQRRRDPFLAFLRGRGIFATFHYVPLHSSPFWRRIAGEVVPPLPVTDRVAASLARLPLHPLLTAEDVDRVVDAVLEAPV
jgi:dTDP-4-amino-4,6-dideoxygalactose transaminase